MCSDSELEAAPPEPEWTVGQYVSVPEDMQPGVNRDAGIGRIVEASVDESTKQGVYTVKYIVDNRTYHTAEGSSRGSDRHVDRSGCRV